MVSITATIRRMVEKGFTHEQAIAAAECIEQEAFPERSPKQKANKRYYQKSRAEKASEEHLNSDNSDTDDALLSPEGSSPTPPFPKPLSSIPPSPPKGGSSPTEFEHFWAIYPNRVGKRVAQKAFAKARKRADSETILSGLRRYVAKTDDRPWCNPATWLNGDRWTDQPMIVQPMRRAGLSPGRSQNAVDALNKYLQNDEMNSHGSEIRTGPSFDVQCVSAKRNNEL